MKPATSIEKVCRIFDAFRSKPALGITETAEKTGLLPSDVHRILASLRNFGYIEQDQSKKYRLGLELLKLGHLVHQRIELREVARPFMRHLSEVVEATVNLAVFDPHDLEMMFIEQVDSPPETIGLRIGALVAPHATAVGKLLLAHLDKNTALAVIAKSGLPRQTRFTICDLSKLECELGSIRSQQYALDREEALVGARCIAAPVRDFSGEVVAALSISITAAHSALNGEARLIAAVQTAAANISARLGYDDMAARQSSQLPNRPGVRAGLGKVGLASSFRLTHQLTS